MNYQIILTTISAFNFWFIMFYIIHNFFHIIYLKYWVEILYKLWTITMMSNTSYCMVTNNDFPYCSGFHQCSIKILVAKMLQNLKRIKIHWSIYFLELIINYLVPSKGCWGKFSLVTHLANHKYVPNHCDNRLWMVLCLWRKIQQFLGKVANKTKTKLC